MALGNRHPNQMRGDMGRQGVTTAVPLTVVHSLSLLCPSALHTLLFVLLCGIGPGP